MAEQLTARGFEYKHAAVNRWENDQSQPHRVLDIVQAWSEITDVDINWLLWGDDELNTRGNLTPRKRNGSRPETPRLKGGPGGLVPPTTTPIDAAAYN